MKLINFNDLKIFQDLRKKMWADYIERKPGNERTPLEKLKKFWEIAWLKIEDLKIEDWGFFVDSERVVIYIRERSNSRYEKQQMPKFHFYNCKTIRERKDINWRYVCNINWKFNLDIIVFETKKIVKRINNYNLGVCRNCLKESNYKWFNERTYIEKEIIRDKFSIEEFLNKERITVIQSKQKNTDQKQHQKYSENREEISKNYRKYRNYICEWCWKDCNEKKWILHVHHIDSDPSNNSLLNLKALCIDCHKKEHEHMQ